MKDIRKALDLTQKEVSERAGCSTAMLRTVEAGTARRSRQLAELLAGALGRAPAERPAFVHRARAALARQASQNGGWQCDLSAGCASDTLAQASTQAVDGAAGLRNNGG